MFCSVLKRTVHLSAVPRSAHTAVVLATAGTRRDPPACSGMALETACFKNGSSEESQTPTMGRNPSSDGHSIHTLESRYGRDLAIHLRSSLLRLAKHRDRGLIGISLAGTLMGNWNGESRGAGAGVRRGQAVGDLRVNFFLSITVISPPSAASRGSRTDVGTSTFGRPLICPLGPDFAVPSSRHGMAWRLCASSWLLSLSMVCLLSSSLDKKRCPSSEGCEIPFVPFHCQVRGLSPGSARPNLEQTLGKRVELGRHCLVEARHCFSVSRATRASKVRGLKNRH